MENFLNKKISSKLFIFKKKKFIIMNERVALLNAKRLEREERKKQRKLEQLKKKNAKRQRKWYAAQKKKKMKEQSLKEKLEKFDEWEKQEKLRKKKAYNDMYWARRRAELDESLKKIGDRRGKFKIVISKNNSITTSKASPRRFIDANEKYDALVKENHNDVMFPQQVCKTTDEKCNKGIRSNHVKYEILLIEKVDDKENKVSSFRNKDGKFIDAVINSEHGTYCILKKDDWYKEETFHIHGNHPLYNRKTAKFILDELILKDACSLNIKTIYYNTNCLYILCNDEFELVVCKNNEDCQRLFETLSKKVGKNKFVIFVGEGDYQFKQKLIDSVEEKTGWSRAMFVSHAPVR